MEDKTNSIFTEIEINATDKQVWKVLTDWNKLPEWSSSFQGISTNGLKKGDISKAYFKNPLTGKNMVFEHEITEYEEGVKFGWSGQITGQTKDHHIFIVEAKNAKTTIFKQEDGFHGGHSHLIEFISKHGISNAYKKFNKELKKRVELLYPQ